MKAGKLKKLLEQVPDDMEVVSIYDDECVKYSSLRKLYITRARKKMENIYWKNKTGRRVLLLTF